MPQNEHAGTGGEIEELAVIDVSDDRAVGLNLEGVETCKLKSPYPGWIEVALVFLERASYAKFPVIDRHARPPSIALSKSRHDFCVAIAQEILGSPHYLSRLLVLDAFDRFVERHPLARDESFLRLGGRLLSPQKL